MAGEAALCCLTQKHICKAGSLKRRLVWNNVSQTETDTLVKARVKCVCVCSPNRHQNTIYPTIVGWLMTR